MKNRLLFFCFLGLSALANAQSTDTYMNNYAQPSPNAAALGKYVDYPVSYYTGVPDISIPIYDLKDGSAHVPVSLSYHASGVRVSEVGSWAGLGWCLNAGGMITRTVRGAPDEGTLKGSGFHPQGYYLDSGLTKLALLTYPVNGTIVLNAAQAVMVTNILPLMNGGFIDGEPDLFFFNFNGYSGKFVFDEYRTPHSLTDDNLKIAVNYSGGFSSFIITTPDGAKYYFGETNVQEVTKPHSTLNGDDPDAALPSSWYLTRMIYPNSLDTVYFNYSSESNVYCDLGPESHLYNWAGSNSTPALQNVCNDNSSGQQNLIRTTATGYRLSSIQSKNYSINFIADTARLDEFTGTTAKRLDSIKIYANGQCIKQWAFAYSYFKSSTATNIVNTGFLGGDTSDALRLKLLSVKEISGDGTIVKPPYKFAYDSTHILPRRLSYDQDHWGYTNSTSGVNNSFFMPGVNYGSACSDNGSNANRNPSWPQMQAATLLTMKDPLGATTSFVFEENVVQDYPFTNVGGLRIKSITVTDSVTGISNVRSFAYAYGLLFHHPTYMINLQNEFYITDYAGYQGYTATTNGIGLLKQSSSIVPMQDENGVNVGYPFVTETFGVNGNGGSKQYVFDMNSDDQSVRSRLDMSNYTGLQTVTDPFNGGYGSISVLMGNGNFNNILPQNLAYYTGFFGVNNYPYTPDQVELRRGKLLIQNTYDSAGNLIENVQNTYVDSFHENLWIRGIKDYATPLWNPNTNSIGNNQFNIAIAYYKLHTGISHLGSTVTTEYKDGKQMVTTHTYGYESPYHSLQTADTTVTSQGDSLISKTYYSFDYANNTTTDTVFAKMRARNQLFPVLSQVWKDNKLMSGKIVQYKDFSSSGVDTFVNPSAIYALDVTSLLTPAQAGESIQLTGQLSTLIPNANFTEKAIFNYSGTTGRIASQNLINDKLQSIIWDNNLHLPLAVVDNAKPADVAYNSFESAETGNWAFTAGSVTTDATAPTGSKVYTLGNAISISGLTSGNTYMVSYWLKSGGSVTITGGTQSSATTGLTVNTSWTYHQVKITGTTSISINGSGYIDEVRLYPATAEMKTYTYDALLRLVNECSINSTISRYDYDSFSRLLDMKDEYGNIVKVFEYNYGSLNR